MKTVIQTTLFLSLLVATCAASANRLELGAFFGPQMMHDARYEAFSENELGAFAVGADLRTRIAGFEGFKLLPVLGYRAFRDRGSPFDLSTTFWGHDFNAGLRVRKDLLSWMGLFVEARGGLFWARVQADAGVHGPVVRSEYRGDSATWTAGGVGGMEFRISPSFLRSRGIERFNLGGELSAGYLRRGDLNIAPRLEDGGDNAMEIADPAPWGKLNPSSAVVQMALVVRFF